MGHSDFSRKGEQTNFNLGHATLLICTILTILDSIIKTMLTSISCVTLNSVGLSAKWVLSDSLQHCLKLEFVVLYPVHENPCLIYHAYAKEYNNLSEYHVYRNN